MNYHRRTIRLKKCKYDQGCFFVTVGAYKHSCIFGEIRNEKFWINDLGKIVLVNYENLRDRFENINLGLIQLMPNHIHFLIEIKKNLKFGRGNRAPTPVTLGKIIAYWKYNSTKEINSRGGVAPPLFKNNWNYLMAGKVFQRNYYERIVRNKQERLKIENYIKFNPKVWDKDRNNPININMKEDY